jgi:hypothetical protein
MVHGRTELEEILRENLHGWIMVSERDGSSR